MEDHDAVIIDLEDAVAPSAKLQARSNLRRSAGGSKPVIVRINASGTPWFDDDLAAVAGLPRGGLMLPKAEHPGEIARIRSSLGSARTLVVLVETALGLQRIEALAHAGAHWVALGTLDLAHDLGCGHGRESLLFARSMVVMQCRLAGMPPPLDGVTTDLTDGATVARDAAHALELGFGGKLAIHPGQAAPILAAFKPSEEQILWARQVVAAGRSGAAMTIDGHMIDRPVLKRAERLLKSHLGVQVDDATLRS